MTEIIHQLILWIEGVIVNVGYPGVAFATFAENVFPPIPSEVVIPFAGFVAASGQLSLVGVWIASTLGSVAGAVVIYYVGKFAGDVVFRSFLRKYGRWVGTSEDDYNRALAFFDRHGGAVVFFGRVIPLVRTIISIPAGADHMPMRKFLLYTTAGSAIWSGLLTYAGYTLGSNWEEVAQFMERYSEFVEVGVLIILAVAVVVYLWTRLRRKSAIQPVGERSSLPDASIQ